MRIEQLLSPTLELWRQYASKPEMDPLTEEDALMEAQLLDVRFDALRLTAGLLFEMRVALQLQEVNTGLLVAHGIRGLSWSAAPRSTGRTAWNVVGSRPSCDDRLFRMKLWIYPDASLELEAERAEFYAGNVPDLGIIPDYGEDDDPVIRRQLPNWSSDFTPIRAVFLEPAPAP